MFTTHAAEILFLNVIGTGEVLSPTWRRWAYQYSLRDLDEEQVVMTWFLL